MKKLVKILAVVLSVVAIGATAKMTVSANSDIVEKTEEKSLNNESKAEENIDEQKTNEDGTFTYEYIFITLDYNIYCMGHDRPHTLVYRVNGGEEITTMVDTRAENVRSGCPQFMTFYYDFPNVKVGDVVEYSYSYEYIYGGFPEQRGDSGSFVVEEPSEK